MIPRTKMNLLSCSLFLGRENLSVQKIILFARWKNYYGYIMAINQSDSCNFLYLMITSNHLIDKNNHKMIWFIIISGLSKLDLNCIYIHTLHLGTCYKHQI